MARKFKLWDDPYDTEYGLWKKKTLTIQPGVTVLAGCNGIGKTTLLHNLESDLKKKNIPVITFDNLHDGGQVSIGEALFNDNIELAATSMCSSEGENIVINMLEFSENLGNFIRTGKVKPKRNPFAEIFKDKKTEPEEVPNERWVLLDAVDSGLSIDNIVELKKLFDLVLETKGDTEVYILVSANEYEMANGEQCLDVYHGKYVTFKDYEDYRKLILDSRKWKDERRK